MASEHYFTSQPASPDEWRPLKAVLNGAERTLRTTSGIFSPARIDKGTAILLAGVPDPAPTGNLLDVGCGWGPVALTMALKSPAARVYAIDVNERCLALTNDNAHTLGLDNVTALVPEAVDPALLFNTIWSNPPIRVGKEELHSLLRTWLPRLAPGGSAWLVVQKNLGADSLHRWLAADLGDNVTVTRDSTTKSFRILHVQAPPQLS